MLGRLSLCIIALVIGCIFIVSSSASVSSSPSSSCVEKEFIDAHVVFLSTDHLDGTNTRVVQIRTQIGEDVHSYTLDPEHLNNLSEEEQALIVPRSIVNVTGCTDDSNTVVFVTNVSCSENSEKLARVVPDSLYKSRLGVRRVLNIIVTSPQYPNTQCTVASVRNIFFGTGEYENINDLIKQESWNKYSLSGEVIGPITIDQSDTSCQVDKWNTMVLNIAKAAPYNVVVSQWDTIFFNYPTASNLCNWGGQANVDCDRTQAGGCLGWSQYCWSSFVAVHEIGHNFGWQHAHSFMNNVLEDYGDYGSYMGPNKDPVIVEVNGVEKVQMGWIPASRVITCPPEGGEYSIVPSGSFTEPSSPQAIRILYEGTDKYLWVTYRVPYGKWDKVTANVNAFIFPSIAVYAYHYNAYPYADSDTLLALLNPTNSSFTFSGYTFTYVSKDSFQARVRITPPAELNNYYTIQNVANGLFLDSNYAERPALQVNNRYPRPFLYPVSHTKHQVWKIEPFGSYYVIRSYVLGKVLDANPSATQYQQTWICPFLWTQTQTDPNHLWRIERISTNPLQYRIRSDYNQGKNLDGNIDVPQMDPQYPAPFLWEQSGEPANHRWILTPTSPPFV